MTHPVDTPPPTTPGIAGAPGVAAPPRPVTPRAARRSWAEQPVRVWVVLAVLVALATLYFTVSQVLAARHERWLIASGIPVQATLARINGTTNRSIDFKRTDRLEVLAHFPPPPGMAVPRQRDVLGVPDDHVVIQGFLTPVSEPQPGASPAPVPRVRVGETIAVRVDPNDPARWTDRTEPKPWATQLTVVVVLLPLLALLGLVIFWQRSRVLKVWRDGELMEAEVVSLKQAALAPLSRQLRFTLRSDDPRIYTVLYPASAGLPDPGHTLWVVAPPGKPGRAVVAKLYQGG